MESPVPSENHQVTSENQQLFNTFNKGLKRAYRLPKPGQPMNQKSLCRHMLKGVCKRKSMCQFSHVIQDIQVCANHNPAPGGSSCEDKGCGLRHPKLCTFFIEHRCHFGHRCLLFHPKKKTESISLVMELQRTVKKMEKAITNLWTELEKLKGPKTSLMVRTMSMDTTKDPG